MAELVGRPAAEDPAEAGGPTEAGGTAEAGGPAEAEAPTEVGGSADAEELAEAGVRPRSVKKGSGGNKLSHANITWSPSAPRRRSGTATLQGLGSGDLAVRSSAAPRPEGRERLTTPSGRTPNLLPGRHKTGTPPVAVAGSHRHRRQSEGNLNEKKTLRRRLSAPSLWKSRQRGVSPNRHDRPARRGLNLQDPGDWAGQKEDGCLDMTRMKNELAGVEGALLPSTDRTGRCPCGDGSTLRTGTTALVVSLCSTHLQPGVAPGEDQPQRPVDRLQLGDGGRPSRGSRGE